MEKNIDSSELEEILEQVSGLSDIQVAFLLARRELKNDTEAADAVGINRSTAYRWKWKSEAYRKAYDMIVNRAPIAAGLVAGTVISRKAIEEVLQDQLSTFSQNIPNLFARLYKIAMEGKDSDSLKAIDLLGRWLGISPDALKRHRTSPLHQNILNWTQINMEKKEDGDYDSETEIEGTFREVPSEQQPLHTEGPDGVEDSHDG